jgi:hypothetical protein
MNKLDIKEATLNIDEVHLNDEFVRMPALIASAAARQSEATYDYQLAKIERERTRARLWTSYHASLLDNKERPTEARVESLIEQNEEMFQARLRELTAERTKNEAAAYAEAMRTKRDMLVSLGANYRAEMQGDPSLRALAQNQRLGRENG